MHAVQQGQNLRVKIRQGGPQAGSGGAGVVNGVALLGGALRIDPQPHLFSGLLGPFAVEFQLAAGIEHKVVGVTQKRREFLLPVSRRKDMGFAAEFLVPQPCLIKAAGGGTGQILPQKGVNGKHGKSLLR